VRTFAAAFDEVLLFRISPEDLLLVGASVPLRLDDARMRGQIAARDAVVGDLSRALNVGPNELLMALRLGGEALRDLVGAGPINRDDHSIATLEALRDMRVHDNEVLLGAIDAAGRDALLKVLVNYGEGAEEEAAFLYGLAKSYLALAADPDRAEAIAARLSSLGAATRAAWVRGEARLQQADHDGALRAWEEILEAEPDNLDALFSLGVYHLDRRDHFAADRFLAPAARHHPEASIILYQHGRNLFYLERYAEAIETLERARRGAGTPQRYPLIDYLVGVSALRLQKTGEAERSLKAYLEWAYAQRNLTVLEVEAHGRLAEVYEQQGEPVKARDERQKAMRLRIEMREFARQQRDSGGVPGRGGLVLPNPASDGSAGEAPAVPPGNPPETGDQPNDP
jgi:Tfp pilus assembly protein PilF